MSVYSGKKKLTYSFTFLSFSCCQSSHNPRDGNQRANFTSCIDERGQTLLVQHRCMVKHMEYKSRACASTFEDLLSKERTFIVYSAIGSTLWGKSWLPAAYMHGKNIWSTETHTGAPTIVDLMNRELTLFTM